MWGVDSDALEATINFFYCGDCPLAFPGAISVLDAANRLDVPVLAAAADAYVRAALAPGTVTTALGLALQYKMADLTARCLELVRSRCGRAHAQRASVWCTAVAIERVCCVVLGRLRPSRLLRWQPTAVRAAAARPLAAARTLARAPRPSLLAADRPASAVAAAAASRLPSAIPLSLVPRITTPPSGLRRSRRRLTLPRPHSPRSATC